MRGGRRSAPQNHSTEMAGLRPDFYLWPGPGGDFFTLWNEAGKFVRSASPRALIHARESVVMTGQRPPRLSGLRAGFIAAIQPAISCSIPDRVVPADGFGSSPTRDRQPRDMPGRDCNRLRVHWVAIARPVCKQL